MAREFLFDHCLERNTVFLLIGVCDGADVAVASVGEDRAHGELFCSRFAFSCLVEFANVDVDGLGSHGCRVFLSSCSENHEVHAFRLG